MHSGIHAHDELMRRGWPVGAFVGVLVASGFLAGCSQTRPQVTLERIRFAEWQQRLQSMKGRIVVVDVWATWCAPCLERFPYMVALNRRYEGRGVQFVSISVDDREDRAAVGRARQFVIQQKAAFANYLMDENIMQAFEQLGVQGIPAVFLYDRTGRLRYNLNGDDPNHQATLKDVDDALATLMAEK